MNQDVLIKEIQFKGFEAVQYKSILTKEASAFLIQLHERFNERRLQLLEEREIEQAYFDAGNFPSFPEETKLVREDDWVCERLPKDLLDRRVEITVQLREK